MPTPGRPDQGEDGAGLAAGGAVPQPEGSVLLARGSEAIGDNAAAAAYYQKVYYEFPMHATDSALADEALIRLRGVLGENFPPVMPQAMLDRAATLMRTGRQSEGQLEYESMQAQLGGTDRELARVRAVSGNYAALSALSTPDASADAERIYGMHVAARRRSLEPQAEAAVEELSRKHPKSQWRLEGLISWGNHFLLRNDRARFAPYYRSCVADFPADRQAAYCHWKLTWVKWLERAPDARAAMEEHVRKYPESEKASAALYFLGRHREAIAGYPGSYYSTLSRQTVSREALSQAKVKQSGIQTAVRVEFESSDPVRLRIDRAKLLDASGRSDWAELELRYAAEQEEQPFLAAMALADIAAGRGAYDQSIRYIKSIAKGYLQMPMEAAPETFWRLAFPLPYRESLDANSRARGLDPHLVAALVRQESEFNPRAVSRAKAYGLTQVLPSTGRQLSRTAGVRGFTASMLFEPDVNLKLGTYYLRTMLDAHGGKWEETLAAYNAGKSRVDQWKTWGEFREPAEFIETIPFSETRNYVQIVLRNADIYRRVYGGGVARAARE